MKMLVLSGFALVTMCILLDSTTFAHAQAPHSEGGEPLTQDQKDYCTKYHIDPCTQNNILAKERINIGGPGTQGTPANQPLQPTDWLIIGIGIGSIIAMVAVGIVVIKMKRAPHARKV
jgi:hypothetical protein